MSDDQRIQPALEVRRPLTPEEKADFDRSVEESQRAVAHLLEHGATPVDPRELPERKREAMLARQALAKLERQWSLVREQGGTGMSEDFWAAFGRACMTVRLAERALAKAMETSR